MSKVAINREGCWMWTGYTRDTGCPYFHVDGSKLTAARLGYKHFIGPVPEKLSLLHACGQMRCVNPSHLKPMPHRDAVVQSGGSLGGRPRNTHCSNGHLLEGDNVWVNERSGARVCKICKRAWRRKYKRNQRQRARSNR